MRSSMNPQILFYMPASEGNEGSVFGLIIKGPWALNAMGKGHPTHVYVNVPGSGTELWCKHAYCVNKTAARSLN